MQRMQYRANTLLEMSLLVTLASRGRQQQVWPPACVSARGTHYSSPRHSIIIGAAVSPICIRTQRSSQQPQNDPC